MRTRSIRGGLLALVLALILAIPALAYDDTAGHWGAEAIDRWSEEEILQGYGGQFRPDAPITRGELAVILDRLMDYQTLSDATYPDVEADSWYEEAVLGAAQANILQGDGASLRPLDPITRQEAAVLLGRALGVAENAAGLKGFTDAGEAASWAAGYLGGMAQAGILNGYQGRIMPAATITRAEVAQLLDNAVAARYDEAGSYTTDADGNVIVSAPGVTLSDMTIKGNLIAAEGIGDGDLILDNVTVKGALVVRGGGEHSIIIKGNSSVSTITAQRRDGGVRLSVEDDASVEIITIDDGSDAVIVAGTVGTLNVAGTEAQVTVAGTVTTVTVAQQAQGASVTVAESGKVDSLTVAAPDAAVTVSGAVTALETADTAADTAVTVGKGGTVESVTANGAGTTVSGAGKVESVTANADNVAVSTPNTTVEASEGTSGVTAGDKDVSGGSSATTPGTSTGGSSSGGGGSSVTYYTVTYRFLDEVLGTEQVASGGHPTGSGITVPGKAGYIFTGWKVEGEWPPVELSDITVTGNVTLYAQLAAVPDGTVTAITEGITIGETDPETLLNLVSGTLAPNEEGNYVLTLQLKAPEGVEYHETAPVLRLTTSVDGVEWPGEEFTYSQAFWDDGIFTYEYTVAPEGATSSTKMLTIFLKWHGLEDISMGGWALGLDMSGLTLGDNPAQTVSTIDGVGYSSLEAAVAAIPAGSQGGDLYLVDNYTLEDDITIPGDWTLNINEDITLTIPEGVTLDNLHAILNRGTIDGGGTLHNGNTIWNRGAINCKVVNYQPKDSDWAVEYYQYAQWNGEGWTLAPLPNMENKIDCSIFAAFNFTEDLNGSDTALAKAIDRINDIPESAGYTFHLLEVRCQLTVNTPLTLPGNTSLALMGGENRGITIEDGGSILNGNVEIITFDGYPVAQLTVKSGSTLTGELYITGNVNDCLVVEDGATVECTLFQRNTQEEEYRPIGEAEYDGRFWLTLADALNAAQADDGGEVFLLRDAAVESNLTIPENVILYTQGSQLIVSGTITLNGQLYVNDTGNVSAQQVDMGANALYTYSITPNSDNTWTIPDHPTISGTEYQINYDMNFPYLGDNNSAVDALLSAAIEAMQTAEGNYTYVLHLRNNYTLEANKTLELPDNAILFAWDSFYDEDQEDLISCCITIRGTLTGNQLSFADSGESASVNNTSLVIEEGGTVSCRYYNLDGDDKLVVKNGGTLTVPADSGEMYLSGAMNLVIDQGGTMTCSGILRVFPGTTLTVNGTLNIPEGGDAAYQGTIDGTGSITGTGILENRNGTLADTLTVADTLQTSRQP